MAADIFVKEDVLSLLKNKQILFLGDSNIRSMYKDFVCLLEKNVLLTTHQLKGKLESSFMGDKLTKGGKLTNGTNYEEVREFKVDTSTIFQFVFLTRCYNQYMQKLLDDIKEKKKPSPDVIVINSCLWDVSRWGPQSVDSYRQNVPKLMTLFSDSLPKETLVIWTTALPISAEAYGGFLIEEVEYLKHTLRYEVMEANIFTSDVVRKSGFNVLDLHYQLRHLMEMRVKDGIHWDPAAVRYITNLILTAIARLWKVELPGKFTSASLTQQFTQDTEEIQLPEVPACLMIKEENDENVPPKDTESKQEKKKPCNKNEDDSALTGNVKIQEQCEIPLDWELDLKNIPKIIISKDSREGETRDALNYIGCKYFKDMAAFLRKLKKESCDPYKLPQLQHENKLCEDFSRIIKYAHYYTECLQHKTRPESRRESYSSDFDSSIENSSRRFSSPTRLSSSSETNDSAIWSAESSDSSYDRDLRRQSSLLPTPAASRYGYVHGYDSPYPSRNDRFQNFSPNLFSAPHPWILNTQSNDRYSSQFDRYINQNGSYFGENYTNQYNVQNNSYFGQNQLIQNNLLGRYESDVHNAVGQYEARNNRFYEDVSFDGLTEFAQRFSGLLQQQMYLQQSINCNERWYEEDLRRSQREYIERNRRARRLMPY